MVAAASVVRSMLLGSFLKSVFVFGHLRAPLAGTTFVWHVARCVDPQALTGTADAGS